MLEQLARQAARLERERVLQLLADTEDNLDELVRLCEDPSLRAIVAQYFKFLEDGMAALAYAAMAIPPEPEEVGR